MDRQTLLRIASLAEKDMREVKEMELQNEVIIDRKCFAYLDYKFGVGWRQW